MLNTGEKVTNFTLKNSRGEDVSLNNFKGKKVIVYFYPRDDTPGCTKEACGFRDNYDLFLEKGAVVLGISADSVDSHGKFQSKYELPFHLLSDPEREVIGQFGAWGEKKKNGKTYEGILRTTFLLDGNAEILKVWETVKPEEHAEEILKEL